ncbi:S41 family peptidase [Ekhidna sp.]
MKHPLIIFLALMSSLLLAQDDSLLKTHSKDKLLEDYDLMVSSLKEAHTGLYWYTSFSEYEKVFKENRDKIYDGMDSYEFFRVLSFVTAADKEGHSRVSSSSSDIGNYISQKGKYLPFGIKTIDKKIYLLNDIGDNKTKGKFLSSIDGVVIDSIVSKMFDHISRLSDGFTTSGKYRVIDRFSFAGYYLDFIHIPKKDNASITLIDPKTNSKTKITVKLVDRDGLVSIARKTPKKKIEQIEGLYNFEIKSDIQTAIMTFNDFGYEEFEEEHRSFKTVVDSLFGIIQKREIRNLVIDIRNVRGGSEGAEDYLFSYLTKTPYEKYKYVETKGLEYSFINYTNYKDDKEELYSMLKEEHYLAKDGRFLRKEGVLSTESPQENPFLGNLYILISGKTYSGGSEFASIAKAQSDALFIGEETGGGFYGQTSGLYTYLLLPNSQMEIRIPLLKFSTNFESADIPFGRGVIPDHKVTTTFEEYMAEQDVELEYTLNLIEEGK